MQSSDEDSYAVSSMAYKSVDYEPTLRWLYIAGVVAMVGAFLFLRPKPTPPPTKAKVFGCYTTPLGPPIMLTADGMKILQSGFPRIGFHLERHKQGIALTAEAPIAAKPVGGRYLYSIVQPGEGLFLNFFKIIDGRRYGVFEERELTQFAMLSADGIYLPYRRASDASCLNVRFR